MIKVSVIIPCYNSERFLEECLDSVLGQTLQEIEVICVDDGSTDGTLDILYKYAEKDGRIRILTQHNQYAGVARNNGMAAAAGKYLSFLDSDDFFEPFMLEKMYEKCEQDKADICICGGGVYDMRTERVFGEAHFLEYRLLPKNIPFSYVDIPKSIFNFTNPAPWNKLFRASFVKDSDLKFQSLVRANDLYFIFTALVMAKRITLVDRWFITYRIGSSSSLQETSDKNPFCFYIATKNVKEFLIDRGLFDELKESFVRYCIGTMQYILSMIKSKEQWLKVAAFLKEQYIPEFELWEYRRLPGMSFNNIKLMSFLVKNTPAKLAEYEPDLRQNEVTLQDSSPGKNILSDDNLKVSIIIYVFNSEKYIKETLSSVLRQTLNNIEIICIDDSSTDNSLEIIEQIAKKDSRIHVICQKNQGRAAGKNTALRIAKGEYIMFLESGDMLLWCALEHLYSKAKHHDLDNLFCEANTFFDPIEIYREHQDYLNKYNFKGDYPEPVSGRELLKKMIGIGDFKTSFNNHLFKRSFLEESKLFFCEDIIHKDEFFIVRSLSAAKSAGVHKEPLYLMRICSKEKSWNNVYDYYLCLLKIEDIIKEGSEFKGTLEKLKQRYKTFMLDTCIEIPEGKWLDFPKEMMKPISVRIPFTLFLIIKMLQTYPLCSWKFAKIITLPYCLWKRFKSVSIVVLKNILKPIVLKSGALTSAAIKIYKRVQ